MKTNETDSEDEEEAVGEIIFFGTKVQKKCNSRKMIIHLVECLTRKKIALVHSHP